MGEEKLNQVLKAHWVDPDLLQAEQFADFFVERGEAMLTLIGEAMGKSIPSGREVFMSALGLPNYDDEFDDGNNEYDTGTIVYDSVAG